MHLKKDCYSPPRILNNHFLHFIANSVVYTTWILNNVIFFWSSIFPFSTVTSSQICEKVIKNLTEFFWNSQLTTTWLSSPPVAILVPPFWVGFGWGFGWKSMDETRSRLCQAMEGVSTFIILVFLQTFTFTKVEQQILFQVSAHLPRILTDANFILTSLNLLRWRLRK